MEAEYVALSKATKHFLQSMTVLRNLSFSEIPIAIFCDNCSVINLAKNYSILELSKDIYIYYHYI
jgi:hypothetical protein